jgi:hypothetical protein
MLSAVHQPEEAAMTRYQILLVFVAAISPAAVPANASFHTYDIVEVYSNADGTVQFIELLEVQGFNSQHLFRNRTISTNSNSLAFGSNLPSNQTAGTSVLIATAGFEELPGGVAADYTIPAGFFNTSGDTINFGTGTDVFSFGPGSFPTDGVLSLRRDLTSAVNSPKNFAGQMGSIAPPLLGDTNADGLVNIDDLNNVRNNFGESGNADGTLPGDAVPWDGVVNIDDLNAVRNNFGSRTELVPEPSALVLAALTASFGLVFRR